MFAISKFVKSLFDVMLHLRKLLNRPSVRTDYVLNFQKFKCSIEMGNENSLALFDSILSVGLSALDADFCRHKL